MPKQTNIQWIRQQNRAFLKKMRDERENGTISRIEYVRALDQAWAVERRLRQEEAKEAHRAECAREEAAPAPKQSNLEYVREQNAAWLRALKERDQLTVSAAAAAHRAIEEIESSAKELDFLDSKTPATMGELLRALKKAEKLGLDK